MQIIKWETNSFDGVQVTKILEKDSFKEIRIGMQAGSEMKEHSAPGSIMVQILSGEIDFAVNGEVFRMGLFDMINLEPNIPHSLTAIKDSIIRLSLSKNDSSSRVFKVLS